MRYCFGNFIVDIKRYELTRNGVRVHVQPRTFDLLAHLIENRHRVVSRHELLSTVWNGAQVANPAINQAIKQTRLLIGDCARAQRIIRTIRGRGYRLVAEVRELIDAPTPVIHSEEPMEGAAHLQGLSKMLLAYSTASAL